MRLLLRITIIALISICISACGGDNKKKDSAPTVTPDLSQVSDAVPRDEPKSKYGNPPHYDVLGKRYYTLTTSRGYHEQGTASWYGTKFHGKRTSSGETYNMYAMTAAHKTLPLPTYVEVTNLDNGKSVVVKVNDRGPFHDDRLIDLSYSAATKLDIIGKGIGRVDVRAISTGDGATKEQVISSSGTLGNTAMYLQVGAFSTLTSAEQLKSRLQESIGDAVVITKQQRESGMLYRVRVGPLASAEYADNLAGRLVELGFSDAHVVTE